MSRDLLRNIEKNQKILLLCLSKLDYMETSWDHAAFK